MGTLERPVAEAPAPDDYYTPERVRALLALLPYLGELAPPRERELAEYAQHSFGPGGWREEAAAKRSDILRALDALSTRQPWAGDAMRLRWAIGLPLRAIAGGLSRSYGVSISHETVRYWTSADVGLTFMCDFLAGRID